jgi:hypothetical protein
MEADMRSLLIAVALGFAMLPQTVEALDILLLGDGDAETQVQPALEAAGHSVTFGGYYADWDGVSPAAADFHTVVLLDGYSYGYPLMPAAATALEAAVAAGTGLVLTEWTAYDVCSGYKGAIIGALMPVTMLDCGAYFTGANWLINDQYHPLAEGLPAVGTWYDDAEWSTVALKPDSIAVISEGTGFNPMASYSNAAGGTVVHINHDMTYTTSIINADSLQLLVNAANFAGSGWIFSDGFETSDDSRWSSASP